MDNPLSIEKHSFVKETIFRLKVSLLVMRRGYFNLYSPVTKFKNQQHLINASVISISKSELWNDSDNEHNWILTAGKIENIRIATKKLNGLEIKANEIFSFWKHIGNPNYGKGYVVGREIREGCIVPTVAGGLCQLSNALYDAALNANFDIIERHRHTKVIKGSLAERNRDATVKWNYVDLRFKSNFDFRIEVELSATQLIVVFRSIQKNVELREEQVNNTSSNQLNDCYSCGNTTCFKHVPQNSTNIPISTSTYILDEKWPEYDQYIKDTAAEKAHFIVPFKNNSFLRTDRYQWLSIKLKNTKATTWAGIYRAFKLRYAAKNKNNIFELSLNLDRKIARAAAKLIPVDSTHLIIAQNLLPFIYETGVLGGRTYDVLMTRLPLEKLHERLDFAHQIHPESLTLNDFRANTHLVELENKSLTMARKIITTHAEIATIFKHKVEKLDWQVPATTPATIIGTKILFPAAAIGRKGAFEISKLAKELQLNLTVSGRILENEHFWNGLNIEKFDGNYDQIGLIVYPTYIEHQPRQVLKAIAKGIPIITTTACGIESSSQVKVLALNDFEQLKNEVTAYLK